MAISAKDVMEFRRRTGLGMMECKQALEAADGDMKVAEDDLRKKGLAKMDGRADRTSAEGRVAVVSDGKKAAIVEVNTETDFTAGNDQFTEMVNAIAAEAFKQDAGDVEKTDAMQAIIDEVRLTTKENVQFARGKVLTGETVGTYLHHNGKVASVVVLDGQGSDQLMSDLCMHVTAIVPTPLGVTDEDVPTELIEKEREIAKGQAIEQGKPENIAEKMVEGKIRKFLEENVLPKQKFVKDDKQLIKDILPEGVNITAFAKYELGG